MQTNDAIVHRKFFVQVDLSSRDQLIALSFLKNNNDRVYLVPSTMRGPKICTRKTNDPQYFFRLDLRGAITLPEDIVPAEVIS